MAGSLYTFKDPSSTPVKKDLATKPYGAGPALRPYNAQTSAPRAPVPYSNQRAVAPVKTKFPGLEANANRWLENALKANAAARPAAVASRYDPNLLSQADAYARAMAATPLALANMDLASVTSDAQYTRAVTAAKMAEIDAGYNGQLEQLQNALRENGDQREYLRKKFELDRRTMDLKEEVVNNQRAANERQPALIQQQRGSVETNYGADVHTLATQERQVGQGREMNMNEVNWGASATGLSQSLGYQRDREQVQNDWQTAMDNINDDRVRVTQARIDKITTLDEAQQVYGDVNKQLDNDVAMIGVGRQMMVLDFWREIGKIDAAERAQKIDAKTAGKQRAAQKAAAGAELARAHDKEVQAHQQHAMAVDALNWQIAADREKYVKTQNAKGITSTPPPPLKGAGPLQPGQTRYTPPPLTGAGPLQPGQIRSNVTAPFGHPDNPFTPKLAWSPYSTNPLGIDDNEFKKIQVASQWSSPDPGTQWINFVNYVNYFKAIMPPPPVARPVKVIR